jgi:hypothetical protein
MLPRLPSAGQFGVQTHVPWMHFPSGPQLALQWQVSRQVPLLQMLPIGQLTPAHAFAMHLPAAQSWFAAQVTPAQGLGARQERLHAMPGPQAASHAVSATHLPVPALQNCPAGQVTPLHGWAKQPAMHEPSTQVCPSAQVTPAHRSAIGTQLARQLVPLAQVVAGAVAQGSGWHCPARQTCPLGQCEGQTGMCGASPAPPSRVTMIGLPPPPVPPVAASWPFDMDVADS